MVDHLMPKERKTDARGLVDSSPALRQLSGSA
jgi:hypothetical protein